MQFGVFSVGDVTRDPVSGDTPSEHERIKALTNLAVKTEEVGFDVFARRMISKQHAVDFPEPNGPRMPRTNASDRMKARDCGPGGLYLIVAEAFIASSLPFGGSARAHCPTCARPTQRSR